MQIHQATEADRTAILCLMRPRDYNRRGLDPTRFLVAKDEHAARENEIIGIGQIKRHKDGTPELASLVVDPAYRGTGVGSALVQALVAHHQTTHPMEPLYLMCLATLGPYYERLGFHALSQRRPRSLATMQFIGNIVGKVAGLVSTAGFRVLIMCHPAARD